MKIIQKCPICNSVQLRELYRKTYVYPGDNIESNLINGNFVRLYILFNYIIQNRTPVQFTIMICKNCGFIFLNPRLEAQDIEVKYRMINQFGSVRKRLKKHPPFNLDKRAAAIYKRICTQIGSEPIGCKVLDFGGASGYNLRPFVHHNKCYLVDYEKWEIPPDIEHLGCTLNNVPQEMKFDIILCCQVFEHLIDPKGILRELVARLTTSGLLYIELPLGCFREFKHIGNPITHINFFSSASFSSLFSECSVNIKSIDVGLRWMLHNRALCLTAIAQKTGPSFLPTYRGSYKDTLRQMRNLLYYLVLIYNRILRALRI